MSATILNRQILTVLYARNAIWRRCEGAGIRTGLVPEDLLVQLQQIYPTVAWSLDELLGLLTLGIRTGIYKFTTDIVFQCVARVIFPTSDDILDYQFYANNAMVIQNVGNRVYVSVSPSNICVPCCTRIIGPIV